MINGGKKWHYRICLSGTQINHLPAELPVELQINRKKNRRPAEAPAVPEINRKKNRQPAEVPAVPEINN